MLSGTGQCCNCLHQAKPLSCDSRQGLHARRSSIATHQRRRLRLYRRLSQAAHNKRHKGSSRRQCRANCHSVTVAETSESGWDNDGRLTQVINREEYLRQFVKEISPESVEVFINNQPFQVADAVQQLIFTYLGKLPPQHFYVQYTAKTEDLAELLKSFMYHGYALRNAQRAVSDTMLTAECAAYGSHHNHQQYALPIMTQCHNSLTTQHADDSDLSRVSGEVEWGNGMAKCDATQYIKQLEEQNKILKSAVSTQLYVNSRGNPLLTYLQTRDPDQQRFTWYVSDESKEAISDFIHTLMGTDCIYEGDVSEHDQKEYGKLLMYCIVVGYLLRQEEIMIRMLS